MFARGANAERTDLHAFKNVWCRFTKMLNLNRGSVHGSAKSPKVRTEPNFGNTTVCSIILKI